MPTEEDKKILKDIFKKLSTQYKEQIATLDELREHLVDFDKCGEFACGKCGELFDNCITGIRNAIGALCSSDVWIIEQLSVLWNGMNKLQDKIEGKEPEDKEAGDYFS